LRSYDTTYRHQHFRSRLEARWAAFFDEIGWRWEYEPFDADGYIPDFAVPGRRPLLVEVKPDVDLKSLAGHTRRIDNALAGHWEHDVLVVGATLVPYGEHCCDSYLGAAGILGQHFAGEEYEEPGLTWDTGAWAGCACCYPAAVVHLSMSFARDPCGYYDGGHISTPPVDLEDRWRRAGTAVRWEPPRGKAS
jgi:hypothetical protein